jgi:transcriptional regulator with XRE-family HTH domain
MGIKSHPPRKIQIALGRRIKRLREKKGLSQGQLAQACDLWRGHIGQIERGNHNIRLSSLLKITKKLDITIERMLRGIV